MLAFWRAVSSVVLRVLRALVRFLDWCHIVLASHCRLWVHLPLSASLTKLCKKLFIYWVTARWPFFSMPPHALAVGKGNVSFLHFMSPWLFVFYMELFTLDFWTFFEPVQCISECDEHIIICLWQTNQLHRQWCHPCGMQLVVSFEHEALFNFHVLFLGTEKP